MKSFTSAALLALGIGSVQAEVSYEFPPTKTSQFVHGLCVMGASSASASASDASVKYSSYPTPFGNDVKLWGDRNYKTYGVSGDGMCEGGIYLEPSKHKTIKKGTKITIGATPEDGEALTVCAMVEYKHANRDGEWEKSLPALGFSESEEFGWNKGGAGWMKSYCKTLQVSYTFPPTKTSQFVHGLCVMGATTATAVATDLSVTYNKYPTPFGDGVKLWGDRNYKTQGIEGPEMCEGGIYLEPNKHKTIRKGTEITLGATPQSEGSITLCAFAEYKHANRHGDWDEELPTLGFRESAPFQWNKAHERMKSYCKTIGSGQLIEQPDEPVTIQPVDKVCASGTYDTNSHYYEVVQYKKGTLTWHEAKAAAEARQFCGTSGHLVTMTSKGESDHVLGLIQAKSCGTSHDTWIGLRDDRKEKHFEWVTGEPFDWDNWCPGQPDNGGNEDFGEIWIDGNNDGCWNDNQADTKGSANGADNDKYVVEFDCKLQVSDDVNKKSAGEDKKSEEVKPAPPAPDQPTEEDKKTTKAYSSGDPHFKTFGGEMYDFHGECDLVLLHNPDFKQGLGMDIHIRTKISDFWSSIEAAVIRLGDDTLEVSADQTKEDWIWFNGEASPSSELKNGIWNKHKMGAYWDGHRMVDFLVRYKQTAGSKGETKEANLYLEGAKEFLVVKAFKGFLRVDVNWKGSKNYDNSVGLLGSHAHNGKRLGRNGKFIEDVNQFGQEWQVMPEVDGSLFHDYEGAVVGKKCIMPPQYEGDEDDTAVSSPIATASLRGRRRLGASALDEGAAAKACDHLADAEERTACIYDVLATQDLDLASTW